MTFKSINAIYRKCKDTKKNDNKKEKSKNIRKRKRSIEKKKIIIIGQ